MISIRSSSASESSDSLKSATVGMEISNSQWLADKFVLGAIILLGGCTVTDFRIRVAQSQVRNDLTPSYWSLAGVLLDEQTFATVPLDLLANASDVAITNGVQSCLITDYDDPQKYPNIAVIQFTDTFDPIRANIERLRSQRNVVDLPGLMLPWLGYIWGAGQSGNPLFDGKGLPSAVFVETVFGIAGIELTPGLSSASSCPEAIWQAAKWWHQFYEDATNSGAVEHARMVIPSGSYTLRQPDAAVLKTKGKELLQTTPASPGSVK